MSEGEPGPLSCCQPGRHFLPDCFGLTQLFDVVAAVVVVVAGQVGSGGLR